MKARTLKYTALLATKSTSSRLILKCISLLKNRWREVTRRNNHALQACGILLSLCLIVSPSISRAGILDWFFPPEEKPPQLAVAIKTTANLADPITLGIIRSKFVRISPGTRLLIMNRVDAGGKRLALSVDGIWVYVDPSEFRVVQEKKSSAGDGDGNGNIIMRRPLAVLLTDGGLKIVLPEGAVLPLHKDSGDSGPFLVKINDQVFAELKPNTDYKVAVDRSKAANVDRSVITAAQVNFFTRGFAGQIYGQFKGCDDTSLIESKYGGSITTKLKAKALYAELAVDANLSQQVTTTTKMEQDEIVTIRYYRRTKTGGEYTWKEIESCGDDAPGQFEYQIRVPGPKEIIIKEQVLTQRGIKIDPSSKRPLISCDKQYNELYNYMAEKMQEDDIHFFIGLIARWKEHGDMTKCVDPG